MTRGLTRKKQRPMRNRLPLRPSALNGCFGYWLAARCTRFSFRSGLLVGFLIATYRLQGWPDQLMLDEGAFGTKARDVALGTFTSQVFSQGEKRLYARSR